MSNDIISCKAAIDAFKDAQYSTEFCQKHGIDHSISMEMVRIILRELPSAQLKCEKCKWFSEEFPYKIGDKDATGFDICFWNRIYPMRVDRDFFCAHFFRRAMDETDNRDTIF